MEKQIINPRLLNVVTIAAVCHAANRAYCESIGDYSQPFFSAAPEWQKDSAINGVQFHLQELRNGRKPSPSASHEKWLEQKRHEGWKYGTVKDVQKKEHPCFMPYDGLPKEQRVKDYIFAATVEAFFKASQEN